MALLAAEIGSKFWAVLEMLLGNRNAGVKVVVTVWFNVV